MKFNEQYTVENHIIKFLEKKLGYEYIKSEDFEKLRELEREYIVVPLLHDAIAKINNLQDESIISEIIRQVKNVDTNKEFLEKLRYGIDLIDTITKKTNTYKIIDFDIPSNNHFVVTNQFYFEGNAENVIPDILIFLNGIPVVDIEAKSATREGVSFEEAIGQIKRYEKNARNLFIPNCFNIATDGFKTVYGATYSPVQYFLEWKDADLQEKLGGNIEMQLQELLEPARLLDLIQNFIVFEETKEGTIKKIARYQQVRATNKLLARVKEGKEKRGLIWHTQGSGKSLTMFFSAWKLRFDSAIQNPKVFILVDRVDLDDQIFETFINCGGKNVERVTSRQDLADRLSSRDAGIFISTIQKFDELPDSAIDTSKNIIVLTDESHRTQYGEYALNARVALKDAFFFGFTGTPVEKTHREFGVVKEGHFERYLDYYSIKQAIDDGATVPVTYEARLSEFAIDKEEIDREFNNITVDLSDTEKEVLVTKFARKIALIKLDKRMRAVAKDIFEHFSTYIAPSGFKAQVVCFDKEAAAKYKEIFDTMMPKEYSEVVFSTGDKNTESDDIKKYNKSKQEIKTIIDRFKDPLDPLKFLIVCDMLLTGFDAPVEQAMYIDKPLWGHNLLQAIARTNRVEKGKNYGKIIDYYGITRNLTEALDFNESDIDEALIDIANLKENFITQFNEINDLFKGINTEDPTMDNLRKCLAIFEQDTERRDLFEKGFKKLRVLFELLSPDVFLKNYVRKTEWFACFYVAYRKEFDAQSEGMDVYQLIAEYGPKLRQLVQDKVDYEGITRNYRELRIDQVAELEKQYSEDDETKLKKLEGLLKREISINLDTHPIFKGLAARLEAIRKEFEEHQTDLSERIKQYELLLNDVKKAEDKAGEMGLDLREYALYGFSEEYIIENEAGAFKNYVQELSEYLSDNLELLWQDSYRREDLLKDVKRKIQSLILQEYKNKLTVNEFPKYLNRLVDVIIKKWN